VHHAAAAEVEADVPEALEEEEVALPMSLVATRRPSP
jgi:hypothetical protein